jgi:actin related protein 2/3 complex subunit 2
MCDTCVIHTPRSWYARPSKPRLTTRPQSSNKAATAQAVGEKGLILLDSNHPIITETLRDLFAKDSKREPMDVKFADFDDVEYQILVTPEQKDFVMLSIKLRAAKDLLMMGSKMALDAMFKEAVQSQPEKGYDATLKFNVDKLPSDEKAKDELIKNCSEIRRIIMGAPFERCFDALAKDSSGSLKPMIINYREKESIYLYPLADRVLVFYSIDFLDDTDRAIAVVFLQEFQEAQRRIQNAPAVSFSKDAPGQLKAVPGFKEAPSCVGYVMFTVFKLHVDKPAKVTNAAMLLQGFRPYLHYHIKASKTYLQSRMRARVELLLKVLNRANPANEAAETAVGRRNTGVTTTKTFRRF